MKPTPAPTRHRWTVAVEFGDGDRIEGTSATDVLERWGRRAVYAIDPDTGSPPRLDRHALKRLIARRVGLLPALTGRPARPGPRWLDDDDEFLTRGENAGAWTVIRR